jgi:hypothetical protein
MTHRTLLILLCTAAAAVYAVQPEQLEAEVTFDFTDIPAVQALEYISSAAEVPFDISETAAELLSAPITIKGENIPFIEAAHRICSRTGTHIEITENTVAVLPGGPGPDDSDSEKPLITVNGRPISESDISEWIERYFPDSPPPEERLPEIKKQIAFQIIAEMLQNAFIDRNLSTVEIDADTVAETLEEHREFALSHTDTDGTSLYSDFSEYYSRFGCSSEQEYADDILVPALQYHRFFEFQASEEDLRDFYEQYRQELGAGHEIRARHILIRTEAGEADDAAQTKAAELLAELKGGADFAELAALHSDCPSSAEGGDLGFFSRGSMVKPFENAAFALEKGEISSPVRTRFGYHIIQVTDIREAKTFEQIRERVEYNYINTLKNRHLAGLINDAEIEIHSDLYADVLNTR